MATEPRSSFIPKQVGSGVVPKKIRRTRVFSIVRFLATVLLVVSILSAIGVFLYKTYATQGLEKQKEALAAERTNFDESEIASVRDFDRQLTNAEILLDAHSAPSKIFDALELGTKASIQYTDFAYERRPSGDISLTLSGVTDDFAKVALQSFQYAKDFILKDAFVTKIGLNADSAATIGSNNRISFGLISNIPSSSIRYEGSTMGRSPSVEPSSPVATTTEAAVIPEADTSTSTSPQE